MHKYINGVSTILQTMKNLIWKGINNLRGDIEFTRYQDIKHLELIGTYLGVDKLDSIIQDKELLTNLINMDSLTAPLYVYEFINNYVKFESYNTVFEPWLSISSPLLYMHLDNPTGVCRNQTELKVISSIFCEKSKNFILGDNFNELSKINEKYDLIISFPPFGLRTQNINGPKSLYDLATTLLIKCGDKIDDNGKLVFLVSDSFLIDKKGKDALKNEGLFVNAVFSIPSGAFLPRTGISSNIVIVSKINKNKTFVAEISQVEDTNKSILQNFKNQKEGKAIQLGKYVDYDEFTSIKSLISENEMLEIVKRIGYPSISLTDISISINALNFEKVEDVEHLANSFYLPKVGNSPVVASLSELKIKPKNYFQIQLDESKANAIYVANYFNTQIGKKLRESLEVGAVIRQISKSQLSFCHLYLPDINAQAEIIEVHSKIQQLEFKLEDLKRNLWNHPKSYKSIVKELKTFNQTDKLENWIDKLPFPISSILWRYYATKDNSKKIEHLFHFFEAFSEFMSMIMLSALVLDKDFYKKECSKWIDKDEKFQNWYLRATFGSWNVLTSRLSKAIREYMGDKDQKDFCRNLFGNPSESFLSMLSSKSIVTILNEVSYLRNKWKGHGGISSDEENKQRILTLEQQLNEFKKCIADAFENTKMLSPMSGNYEDGIFTFNAKELIGVRTPFNEITINSLNPLDKKKLYLSNSDQIRHLELLPFVKFIESSDAIYFYTSIESKDVRWVSYHFDKESEINQPADNELYRTFEFLKP